MTQEDKQLLLKDLCARLPYHPVLHFEDRVQQEDECLYGFRENGGKFLINDAYYVEEVKPYLRPLLSMTDEEREEYRKFSYYGAAGVRPYAHGDFVAAPSFEKMDWLNAHHFDYRGLIEMGLALPAPEGMYKMEG